MTNKADNEELLPRMDWEQVALLDGAAPCFFIEGVEFCGRAESYPGHGNSFFHDYVSLEQFIRSRTRLSDSKDWKQIGNLITTAAQTVVDIAQRDRMQCPRCGTIEMIIRDNMVTPLLARISDEAARAKAEKVVADIFGIESGLDIAPEFYKPLADRITALLTKGI